MFFLKITIIILILKLLFLSSIANEKENLLQQTIILCLQVTLNEK